MDPKELLALLDLQETRAGPEMAPALAVSTPDDSAAVAGSTTALEIDVWGMRRGRDLLAESERIRKLGLEEAAVADCHAAAFDPEP